MNNKLAVVIAIILGLVATFAAQSYLQEQEMIREQKLKPVLVVVARDTLRVGDIILPGSKKLIRRQIPQNMMQTGMITHDQLYRYRGFVVNQRIDKNQPVTADKLDPNYEKADSSSSVVAEGMRAITVNVDLQSGVAGLIRPGDRVDIIATFDLQRQGSARGQQTAGVETLYLLQNVRVIALDDRTDVVGKAVKKRTSSSRYATVTIEVKPTDALRVINAQEQGRLRLMLRNRTDVALEQQDVDGVPIGVNVVRNELGHIAPHTTDSE